MCQTLVVLPSHCRPEDGTSDAQQLQAANPVGAEQNTPVPYSNPQAQGCAGKKELSKHTGQSPQACGGGCPPPTRLELKQGHGEQGMLPSSGKDKRALVEMQTLFRLMLGSL